MADFRINTNIAKISVDSVLASKTVTADEVWLTDEIDIVISNPLRIVPIIIDFSLSVASIIEYTLDGNAGTFIPFEAGEISGGQSRFIRVTNGNKINFRAKTGGTLNRCIVGEP